MSINTQKLRIISGGQTGPDQAGIKCARDHGYPTGGTACQGWMTERGPAPWLADYGLVECVRPGYPARTSQNVKDSDLTIIFDEGMPSMNLSMGGDCGSRASRGSKVALIACFAERKDFWINPTAENLTKFIRAENPSVINVAGNRASKWPNGFFYVYRLLSKVFKSLDQFTQREAALQELADQAQELRMGYE